MMGMGQSAPGMDGNFSSTARASYAAIQSPYLSSVLSEAMVTSYEQDQFYDQFSAEIDDEMARRRAG